MPAKASTVIYSWTNWSLGYFTNALKITPVSTNAASDGTYLITGAANFLNSTNGLYTNSLAVGNYRIDVQGLSVTPVIYAVPNDSMTYQVQQLLLSGYNTYNYTPGVLQILNPDGSLILSPTNGKGFVTISVAGNNTNYINQVGLAITNYVSSNYTLKTVFNAFTNSVKSAAFTSSNIYQPTSSNLTNWATLSTNVIAGATTNLGSAAFTSSNIYQPSTINGTNWSALATNNLTTTNAFKTFTNSLGTASLLSSNIFQPSSSFLTNWAEVTTNQMVNSNVFIPFTNTFGNIITANSNIFQMASLNLSNYSGIATNTFTSTNEFKTLTNQLGTAAFLPRETWQATNATLTALASSGAITNILAGSNVTVTINSNTATINTAIPNLTNVVFGDSAALIGTNNFVQTTTGIIQNNGIFAGQLNYNTNIVSTFVSSTNSVDNFIGGGFFNYNVGYYNGMIGGQSNNIAGAGCFTGGGKQNSIQVSSFTGFDTNTALYGDSIIGGVSNLISNSQGYNSIIGGQTNWIYGTRGNAMVGGLNNYINGVRGAIIGGFSNSVISGDSVALGRYAKATNDYCFVWNDGDGANTPLSTKSSGQFLIHAAAGVCINGNTPLAYGLLVNGPLVVTGTNNLTGAFVPTNIFVPYTNQFIGTAAFVSSNLFQPANAVLSNLVTLGTNAFWNRSTALQPASTALTNFSSITTNTFWGTNIALQPASGALTNFSTLGTNAFVNRNDNYQSGSLQLSNFVVITTNGFLRTNIATVKGTLAGFNGTNWVAITPSIDGYILSLSNATATGFSWIPPNSPLSGTGSPQSAVAAFPGASYLDTSSTNFYVKTTGAGTTTGWSLLVQGAKP